MQRMLSDPPQKKKIVEKRKKRKKRDESFLKQVTTCKYCIPTKYFCTARDYGYHIETHWKKTKKGEILPSELDMDMVRRLRLVGKMIEGEYRYTLLGNGEVIFRQKL